MPESHKPEGYSTVSPYLIGEDGPAPAHMHVYVPDVDAAYRSALEAGAESVQEPTRREGDSDRRGGVRDVGGNTSWIATVEGLGDGQ